MSWCSKIDGQDQYTAREEEESSKDADLSKEQDQCAARKEKEESSKDTRSDLSKKDANCGHAKVAEQAAPDANGAQKAVQVLLENLHHGHAPVDESAPAAINSVLDLLHNHAMLSRAQKTLQN